MKQVEADGVRKGKGGAEGEEGKGAALVAGNENGNAEERERERRERREEGRMEGQEMHDHEIEVVIG